MQLVPVEHGPIETEGEHLQAGDRLSFLTAVPALCPCKAVVKLQLVIRFKRYLRNVH